MCRDASGNAVLPAGIEHRAVLVALVQSVIGAFDKDLGPFNERGGKKSGESADQDFLEERGVHPFLRATMMPVRQLFAEDVDLGMLGMPIESGR
jgi:hypothetical protein